LPGATALCENRIRHTRMTTRFKRDVFSILLVGIEPIIP
jgi:hypothetical protein